MRSTPCVAALVLAGFVAGGSVSAQEEQEKQRSTKLSGDFRFRLENDWDSRRADGTDRQDRLRARIRARLAFSYDPPRPFALGLRIRTGSKDSQQSPHITIRDFDDNPEGDRDVVLDKWFVRFSGQQYSVSVGRSSFPFWKQDELFWDDDVTPAGVAYRHEFGGGKLAAHLGYFALPDGMSRFNGQLAGGQIVYTAKADRVTFTGAGGVFVFDGEEGARNLRNRNGARDYTIGMVNLQAKFTAAGKRWILGIDLMQNGEDYDDEELAPFGPGNRDETDGFATFARVGGLGKRGDWLLAYYYARIEAFAVNASFAQDDWVRWGSATQTDSSDLKGHEFRAGYALTRKCNLLLRLYLVEAITTVQDGKRLRLDFNYKF